MHGRPTKTLRHMRPPRARRRGSVLILVVSVLVLLAVSAAVYVGVGQQERRAASASEMKSHRDAVSAKVVDYVGQLLVRDVFGNNAQAIFPFEDRIAALGFGNFAMGERWDYPYTRPGNVDVFNVLADPWLADLEPSLYDAQSGEFRWRHISNIHPQGKFVSFDQFFTGGRSLQNSGFYADLFIKGANSRPYDLDTYTGGIGTPFRYNDQLSRQVTNDATDDAVTWADRMAGADTDGDGRIDARWTELADVYGLPKEMRIFVAARIIDLSAMLNMNANFEFGASAPNDMGDAIGLGRTPADVDLYTALFDAFALRQGGTSLPNDTLFVDGPAPGRFGFKQHVNTLGIQDAVLGAGNPYSAFKRSTREQREVFWSIAARQNHRTPSRFSLYGVDDELALRSSLFTPYDRSATRVSGLQNRYLRRSASRLEHTFDGLNLDPFNPNTWYNPMRTRFFREELLDYSAGTPTIDTIQDDFRHLLTTFNGEQPMRPWNRAYAGSDSPVNITNINALVASNAVSVPQTLAGGFMWALAPFAADVGNANGSDSGFNLFGSPVIWQPTSGEEVHYGDGDAGYAFFKSLQLAVNAVDYYDSNSTPTVRTGVFSRNYTAAGREDKEIIGVFEHGRVPANMTGPSGTQNNATLTVIGLERQPFIREVCAVNVYGQLDDNPADQAWNYDPTEGNEEEWMVKILAIELGNPWPNDISAGGYRIRFGNDPDNVWPTPAVTIPAGESIVVYVGADYDDTQQYGRRQWESIISQRTGGATVHRIGGVTPHLEFEDALGEFDEVTLWRTATYGLPGNPVSVLVDRLRPATSNNDFPNIIDLNGENIPGGNILGQTEFAVRVGSMRRYCDIATGGGMPGYIFASPVSIATSGRDSNDYEYNEPNPNSPIPANLIAGGLTMFGGGRVEYINDPSAAKGYGTALPFPPFELNVANLEGNSDSTDEDFRSSVDLLLLSSVGHIHCEQIAGGVDPNFTVKDLYITASELLGDESLRGRMAQQLSNAGVPNVPVLLDIVRPAGPSSILPADFRFHGNPGNLNRFVGRLDYTRFIPRDASAAMVMLAVPLATRVIDAFDTVTPDSNVPLVQGRININTAPRRVIEALPYLHPRFTAGPIPARNQDLRIAESLRAYRDRGSFVMQSIDWSSGTRANVSNMLVGGASGLRDDATSRGVAGHVPGFTSVGELLLATRWRPVNGGPSYEVDRGAVAPNESAYVSGHDQSNLTYEPLDTHGFAVEPGWRTAQYDPTDDPTEHLALIRAIRSCVSTRSDVFAAYITLVGFTPDDVRVADEQGGSVTQKLTRLQASMEQRYLVVFDRSGVKTPSDRPRVLFAVQEVPSR